MVCGARVSGPIVRIYDPAVCKGRNGDLESLEFRGALSSVTMMGLGGDCGLRPKKPRNGIFGVLLFGGAGEFEYTEEPLIIDRTLLCNAPNREVDCDAGDPSGLGGLGVRGDRRNNGSGNPRASCTPRRSLIFGRCGV